MHFELTILGCNGAIPAYDRHPTAQFLTHHGQGFLLDCGEGTQMQMAKYAIKRGRLDHIFITHIHGDHFFGLMGLIGSLHLNHRERPLHIYGFSGIEEIIMTHLRFAETKLKYELIFHPVVADIPRIIYESPLLTVETIILQHRIPTTGFLFREKQNLFRKMLPAKIEEYQIPVSEIMKIKQGGDFTDTAGRLISNAELTTESSGPKSYAFCTDTVYTESFVEQIKGVDLLYHEATFTHEHAARARETMHTTTKEAATIALKAKVGKLIIGHFSARYENLYPLLEECREVLPNTELALEGRVFHI